MPHVSLPDWKTSTAGTRVRVALWLASEIGEGGSFRKAMLRAAFPGVEQVDRRMRDLRSDGWILQTYQQDRSLGVDELRVTKIGAPVWDPSYTGRPAKVPRADRAKALAADDFRCIACGICAGESYPDEPLHAAQLTVTLDGSGAARAVCGNCHGSVGAPLDAAEFASAAAGLAPDERKLLIGWVQSGARSWSQAEELWAKFRWMTAEERSAAKELLQRS